MPKGKDGQLEVNGDGGRTGIDNGRGTGPSGNSNNNGIGSANGSGNDSGHKRSKSNSSDNRHNGGNTDSQSNLNLGPFTQATNEVIKCMAEAYDAIGSLHNSYAKHRRDIEEIPKIQERCVELEKQYEMMRESVKRHQDTITTLEELGRDKGRVVEQSMANIRKEKEELEAEMKKFERQKETAEKRAKIQETEQKNKHDKELEKLKTEQNRLYENRKERLEQDAKKHEDEIKKRVADLEANNRTLTKELDAQKGKIEEQQERFISMRDECDDQRRVKNSFKEEKKKLEMQLKEMKDEFALNVGRTTEF